jgi:hypothetical protein
MLPARGSTKPAKCWRRCGRSRAPRSPARTTSSRTPWPIRSLWVTSQSPTADPSEPDIATVQRLNQVLDQHCEAVGRDPATVRRAVQFRLPDRADDALRVVELHARAGFTDLILMRYGAAESAAAAAEAIAALLPKLRTVG